MRKLQEYRHGYWRSLEQRRLSHDEEADGWREFPEGTPSTAEAEKTVGADRLSRRRFVGVMGASAALAGATTTTGCIRKPVENILPFGERPEDLIPGKPLYYASAFVLGGAVEGVLVESQDGRPTKIEGNPRHAGSQGGTSVFAQASVLDLYDPDRTRAPYDGEAASPDIAAVKDKVGKVLEGKAQSGGNGLALVLPHVVSPTLRSLVAKFKSRFPSARLFVHDPMAPLAAIAAAEAIGGKGARVVTSLAGAAVVVSIDCDFLASEREAVRLSHEWAKTRRLTRTPDLQRTGGVVSGDVMSRLYVVEPHLTPTGIMADHRRRIKGSRAGDVLIAIAKGVDAAMASRGAGDEKDRGPALAWPSGAEGVVAALPAPQLDPETQKMVAAIVDDLTRPNVRHATDVGADGMGKLLAPTNVGRSAIVVGERQAAWVHALAHLVNAALGNLASPGNPGGSARWLFDGTAIEAEPIDALGSAGADTVICLDTNPAHSTPGQLQLAQKLAAVTTIHLGHYRDETGQLAKFHLPLSHWLEAWGDVRGADGTVTIQQPLIAPLFDTYSAIEWMGFFADGAMMRGHDRVRDHHAGELGEAFSDRQWRRWLHDGIATSQPREPVAPSHTGWGSIAQLLTQGRRPVEGVEVNFHIDPKVGDGRFANNGWMQELPHPVTKLTWDNAAYVSKATADKYGVSDGDLVDVKVAGGSLQLPIWVAPGQADDTVSIALGYGRKWGSVANGAGFDAYPIRPAADPWIAAGELAKAGGAYTLASTQDYGTLKPPSHDPFEFPERPIVIENDLAGWAEDPTFVEKANLMTRDRLHHLWDPPKLTGKQQWGMSIDLNTCTGCNACVIACQAENNIPVVGKSRILMGREMHWMRIDRYFRGSEDEPTAVVQPMLCQHCESAPCETVCPVAATTHSPEGLNDMAYNRCIGTRYCSNNCPYKVRRFNFFHYNLDLRPGWLDDDADGARLRQLQRNPDVTVRFRGVIEKCTYCVQRINQAKIEAHVAGQDKVADGAIVTACQQVCPTGAIVFGDIADPDSAVSRAKANSRDYQVLRDLNNGPRTTYLARIRNPHPSLERTAPLPAPEEAEAGAAAPSGHAGPAAH
jgi:Fe-S-cluster-containing dehydrogenase component